MKRISILISIILIGTLTGFAQANRGERSINPADTSRYLVSKWNQNWFVSFQGNSNWWQGSDQNPAGNFTSLNGPTFGGGIYLGKWITHNIAFRLGYDVHRSNSYINGRHINLTHINFLYGDNPQLISVSYNGENFDYYKTSFMYHNLHGDVIISPVDLIQGYYTNRFYTPLPFFGMGAACVSEHFLISPSVLNHEGFNFELSFDAGLINTFWINKYLDIDLTFLLTGQRWTLDSWTYEYEGQGGGGNTAISDNRPRMADLNYSATAGLTWYPGGRIYELPFKYVEVRKETVEIIKHIHDTVPCQEPIINISGGDTITEIVSFPLSIFFHRDKSTLMSGRDLVNLEEIATVAKEKGWTVHLRGSCDSATATAEYNDGLAKRRCNTIMNILIDKGVPMEQIELEPVGGVKELDPTEYDRRVLITLGKKIKNN